MAVNIEAVCVSRDGEQAQVRAVGTCAAPVGTVCIGNASELVYSTDKGAHEQKVDKGHELGRVPGARVEKESGGYPCGSEYRYNEENEDRRRREEVARVVPVDEPGQHAQRGHEGDELEEAPKDEGQPGDGHDGGWGVCMYLCVCVYMCKGCLQ